MSSRAYDYDLFDKRVIDFEWVDHQAPTLPVLVNVAYKMYTFLRGIMLIIQKIKIALWQYTATTARAGLAQLLSRFFYL